ncbi:hypothetical protein NHX12_019132 [Muraenolepis orangiensis]|uniref:Ig-like domain-containing protein n=1 Tax=Muraenolepis orangiensis TaxID=630683 RepID=A0A9Q0EW66_9TELE|nr:hypothetical protein NHX12_019132 [Muraenolepis orangiensis]
MKDTNMSSVLFVLLATAISSQPGVSSSVVEVTQTGSVVTSEATSVTLSCSHGDTEVFYLLWYRYKRFGDPLVPIGYIFTQIPNLEAEFKHRFSVEGNGKSHCHLTIANVSSDDSGVYYCGAVRHGGAKCALPLEVQCVTFQMSGPQIVPDKQAVVMNCSHDDSSLYVMLWYLQRRGVGGSLPLVLLGSNYAAGTSNYQEGFEERFEIQMTDRLRGALVLREAAVADTAVYFCAASEHSDQRPRSNLLSLICYNYIASDPTYEAEFKGRFEMRRENVTRGTLVRLRAEANDSGEYFCAGSTRHINTMLVTVLPLFNVFLLGLAAVPAPIQSGELMFHPGVNVTLHCSLASDMSSHTMLWYRQHVYGEPVQFIVNEYDRRQGRFQATLETEQNRFLLEIAELQPDDSGTYYCAAYHKPDHGIQTPRVEVLRPSAKECRDRKERKRKKTLVCVASGFYPDHVTVSWHVDGKPVTDGVATDHRALRKGKYYQITSRLRVAAERWQTAGTKFNCTVSFFDGKKTTNYSDAAKLSYGIFIVKNIVYGIFITILAWKLGLNRSHATVRL